MSHKGTFRYLSSVFNQSFYYKVHCVVNNPYKNIYQHLKMPGILDLPVETLTDILQFIPFEKEFNLVCHRFYKVCRKINSHNFMLNLVIENGIVRIINKLIILKYSNLLILLTDLGGNLYINN